MDRGERRDSKTLKLGRQRSEAATPWRQKEIWDQKPRPEFPTLNLQIQHLEI
jgi:hypothetical protein